jgi:hypothetical protein
VVDARGNGLDFARDGSLTVTKPGARPVRYSTEEEAAGPHAEIIARVMAARIVMDELGDYVPRAIRRAKRLNPLPGLKAFRMAQEFQALNRKTAEADRLTMERVAFILGGAPHKNAVCSRCGSTLSTGARTCQVCGYGLGSGK